MMEPAQSPRAAVETLVGCAVLSFIWALVLNATLELFHSGGDVTRLVGYDLYLHFRIFALSAAVIWLVVLCLLSVTGRLWLTCALTLCVTLVLGVVDHVKIGLRREPVYPSDVDFLSSPRFLFSMVSPWHVLAGAVLLAVVALGIVWFGRIPARTFKPIRRTVLPSAWLAVTGIRVVVLVVCVCGLAYVGRFNSPHNKVRAAFEHEGAQWAFWYQTLNYTKNGVVPGLLYNLGGPAMLEPADYSRATMARIVQRYTRTGGGEAKQRTDVLDDVNVVTVLSEAFSDPTDVKGASLVGDPIPRTRATMSRTTSGKMLTQLFGGGTANMEFEVLTGQSLAQFEPQMNTPYQQLVYKFASYPSVVGYMKSHGHDAIAVHPYMTSMYKRNAAYRALGFDEFIHDSTMTEHKRIDDNPFISDESAFDEVVKQLRVHRRPTFVNLVTMQNHYPMANLYRNPWPVAGVTGDTKEELGGYARGLNYTDKALKAFLSQLSASPEKTAVVFYGDHLPAFWPDDIYDQNGDPAMKSTPFFIWTNFESSQLKTTSLTSPIYFLPMLFRQLHAAMPPYYVLLSRLQQEVPALEQGVMYDANGRAMTDADLDRAGRRLMHDYRLVQYDLSVGHRYSAGSMFYTPGVPEGPTGSVQAQGEG